MFSAIVCRYDGRLPKYCAMQSYVYVPADRTNILPLYEGWNFNSGNYLFTTDTK